MQMYRSCGYSAIKRGTTGTQGWQKAKYVAQKLEAWRTLWNLETWILTSLWDKNSAKVQNDQLHYTRFRTRSEYCCVLFGALIACNFITSQREWSAIFVQKGKKLSGNDACLEVKRRKRMWRQMEDFAVQDVPKSEKKQLSKRELLANVSNSNHFSLLGTSYNRHHNSSTGCIRRD